MDDYKDKTPYIPPGVIMTAIRDHGVLCSSFGGSSTEGIDPGDSYGDDDFNW